MARTGVWGKLALLTATRAREPAPGFDFSTNVMHIDADAICAKCMRWVAPHHIVRRTAFGLIQHESCVEPAELVHRMFVGDQED